MPKKRKIDVVLDEYEQEIEDNLEKAKRLSPEKEKKEITIAREAAAHYFHNKKEQRVSIHVFTKDLQRIKKIADEEGLAYQTLITNVLHQYAIGRLKTTRHR